MEINKTKINKKCADKVLLLACYEEDGKIYAEEMKNGSIVNGDYVEFNIYDPERVDAYKVAEKLELYLMPPLVDFREAWLCYQGRESLYNPTKQYGKDQHTAIVKCIEAVVGDI